MSDLLTVDDFSSAVDETFMVQAEEPGPIGLVLTAARGLGRSFDAREAFVLTFRGPNEPRLPQATYRLEHPQVGAHDIFIVPVAQSEDGYEYEANFT